MRRGEIYRTAGKLPEPGFKPGYYLVVSRNFIVENEDVATVICAPVYGEILGLRSEVVVGPEDGIPRTSAVRCDFLTLMFKRKLTRLAGTVSAEKVRALDEALAYALEIVGRE